MTIKELIKQHANDPQALADAVERLTLERASDLCRHHAQLFQFADAEPQAKAAMLLAGELDKIAHGEAVNS